MASTDLDVDALQALLDILAGWGAFVSEQSDDPLDPDYPKSYSATIFDLQQKVAELVWNGQPTLTPHEFVQRYVSPQFGQTSR